MRRVSRQLEEQAALWADRRRRGDLDTATSQALQDWLAAGPGRAELLAVHDRVLADPALAAASEMIALEQARPAPRRRDFPLWIAGGVAVASVCAALLWVRPSSDVVSHQDFKGTAGGSLQVALDDGSQVQLNGDSDVRTTFTAGRRDILLHGEGFFSVAKDAKRPFSVITATHRITALGTRFNVDERTGGAVEVVVLEGKVEVVALNQPDQRIVLQAGGRLLADASPLRPAAVQRLAPDMKSPDWTEGWIDADDMTLADLVVALKRRSAGFDAAFVEPALSERRISGRFEASEPEAVLEVVAEMQGLSLRREPSGRILIDR